MIKLSAHKTRVITFYGSEPSGVPKFPKCRDAELPESCFPLPFLRSSVRIVKECEGAYWIGGDMGLARWCAEEENEFDIMMYFSADRDLYDNRVLDIECTRDCALVKTRGGLSLIELKTMTCGEKARLLTEETLGVVARKGMISQRGLTEARELSSRERFGESDNDGGFTASCCMGMLFEYAVSKREKGESHPDTLRARANAVQTLDACLLLMYIHGRGDGFIARTYITHDAPEVNGFFLRRSGSKAVVTATRRAVAQKVAGKSYELREEIPQRLKYLFEREGYTQDELIFKCDTSSDEITLHIANLYFAHMILGCEDAQLDSMICSCVERTVMHILENGRELIDFTGEPTSWARWSDRYFSGEIGWADAPLNASELLMYLAVAKAVCPQQPAFEEQYRRLAKEGLAGLGTLHERRAYTLAFLKRCAPDEDIMYGDHMLANLTYFMLILLEDDEELRSAYEDGWQSWRSTSIGREHNPVYDIPFLAVCDADELIDEQLIKLWFYRTSPSRLCSKTSLEARCDIPKKEYRAGYIQSSCLVPPDEKFVSKYDKDSLCHYGGPDQGVKCVEMCSPFTLPYFLGRYYGVIEEDGK